MQVSLFSRRRTAPRFPRRRTAPRFSRRRMAPSIMGRTVRSMICLTAWLLVLVWSGLSVARADETPQGWWLDATGKAGVLISPCGAQLCGRIEWLRVPLDSAGKPKTDIHNPDAALRARLVCGLTMMGGFVPDGDGGWHGGWIYDPSSGNTYKS